MVGLALVASALAHPTTGGDVISQHIIKHLQGNGASGSPTAATINPGIFPENP
jgi:hypothetical protein